MKVAKSGMAAFALSVFLPCGFALAQESLLGKYSGSYERKTTRGEQHYGVELTLESIENGVVKGKVVRHGRQCPGSYPIEGTLRESALNLRSGKGGTTDDCSANLRLKVEGDKLRGTIGSTPIELAR